MNFSHICLAFVSLVGCKSEITNTLCFPDKGIKSARIFVMIESDTSAKELEMRKTFVQIDYDTYGRPIKINNTMEITTVLKHYDNGRLTHIINRHKDMPEVFFLSDEKYDSIHAAAPYVTDTFKVLSHYEDGRPSVINLHDGSQVAYTYSGCDLTIESTLNANGDTSDQVQLIYERGVVVESIWTQGGLETKLTRKLYDYEFNEQGHWVRRKYITRENEEVVETRELTYY